MTRIRLLAPVFVVLGLAACTTGPDPAPTTASQAPAPADPASSSAAVTYEHKVIDLCNKVDLAPLAPLRLTLQAKRAALPPGVREGEGDSCLHEMRTAEGKTARLTVSAVVTDRPDQAQREVEGKSGGMTLVGPVTGPWQQGAALTRDGDAGVEETQSEVRAASDNLYLSVWLSVGDKAPVEALQPSVTKIAETTFATVTEAWRK